MAVVALYVHGAMCLSSCCIQVSIMHMQIAVSCQVFSVSSSIMPLCAAVPS